MDKYKTDAKILKHIITSSAKIEASNQKEDDYEDFPVTRTDVIDNLSKTFTKLLTYKVSQEAHQRYSVKLNVIDTLRDWSRIKGNLGNLSIFKDAEQSSDFLLKMLTKYLTPEMLNDCDNINDLILLAEILLNSITKNRSSMKHLVKVIERIIVLPLNKKSEKFSEYIINKKDELKLDTFIIDKIYVTQKSHFIEKPITDCFVAYCSNRNKQEQINKLDFLFEKIVDSPSLFLLVSNQLKDMFVMTNYAQESQDFIQSILEKLQVHCNKYNKDTLDLYPTSLQFCVILLRIKPYYHTEKSKNHTVQSLKQICLKNDNDALILVSHFPDWLPVYLEFFENLEVFPETQKSDVQETTDIGCDDSDTNIDYVMNEDNDVNCTVNKDNDVDCAMNDDDDDDDDVQIID